MAALTPMQVALEVMDRDWQWGVSDCCTAACDAFLRLHGVDPMKPLRGRYTSRMGALRLIAVHGGWLAMTRFLAREAGLVTSHGGPGEIGLADSGHGPALVFGVGDDLWAGKTDTGMQTLRGIERCWRV